MISNIPIFRAKKIDSDDYVIGFLKNCTDTGLNTFWMQSNDFIDYIIDIDTLSINFPNMVDSQGNKIFASLQEDGKGGDIIGFSYGIPFVKVEAPVKYKNSRIDVLTKGHKPDSCPLYELEEAVGEYEVIGIQ